VADNTAKLIAEIHAVVVKGKPANEELLRRARAVVSARHYHGDDGWDKLKNAIGELEELVVAKNSRNA
jgi:hypothetical protein